MIEISNVTKMYDGVYALKDVSINIEKGTIHGVIGENGAGKTTLIQCVAGILKPDGGEIKIGGQPVYENTAVKEKIGYVADRNMFFSYYRIKDMVSFYSDIYSTFSREKFDGFNKIFKLPLNRRINQLSKGMQMRLSIMLNISIRPEVLILDEPTSGLDAIAKKQVLDILIDEVEENGMTVLISSHHLSELEKLCNDITIINYGSVKYQSSVERIKEKVKKLQVLFGENTEVDFGNIQGILSVEKVGSIYYIVTDSYGEDFIGRLKSMGATLAEEIGMNLEEIFIYTSEKR